jgi:hypothetical protein
VNEPVRLSEPEALLVAHPVGVNDPRARNLCWLLGSSDQRIGYYCDFDNRYMLAISSKWLQLIGLGIVKK